MSANPTALLREALELDADQRAIMANALLESLRGDVDTSDVEDAWRAESLRRLNQIRAGEVELVDAAEHHARLRASLTDQS